MYTLLIGAVLSALVAAAPSETARDSKLRFRLRGGSTGITKVDGQLLEARPQANTFVGFSLPYGQVPQIFTLDDKTSYVYAADTGSGTPLVLSAVALNDTGAVKTAALGSKGADPLHCESVGKSPDQLLCGVNINGTLYNKLLAVDFKGDGNYELGIGRTAGTNTIVALNVETVS